MVSDFRDNVVNIVNQTDEEYKNLINSLCEDKIKLLKEKKYLLNLLADKDEQILKISENFQKKWENVCHYLQSVEELYNDLNTNVNNNRVIFSSPMDSSFSNASFFTTTDTTTGGGGDDSYFTSSSESLVAATNDTIRKSTLQPKETYFSLNSLSNFKSDNDEGSDDNDDASYPGYCTINRPQSHCLPNSNNNNKNNKNNHSIDAAVSEPQFIIADEASPKPKRLMKKSSTMKSEKPIVKIDIMQNNSDNKNFAEYKDKDAFDWLVNVVRLPRLIIEDLKLKNKIDGVCLDQMSEQKLCKLFGTNDKLIKKKIMLGLEEVRSSHNRENIPDSDLSRKDDKWVSNVWLKKHLGLGHLSHAFQSRSIDGRLLKYIGSCSNARQKEFISIAATNYDHLSGLPMLPLNFNNKNTSEPSKSDLRSIKYGLELLSKFNFEMGELERRRTACENNNLDVLVWTNERIAKWFNKMNLKNYIRGIEYSGIHGGIMVLDPQFSMVTMSKLLQIPIEVVKKNNLDEKFSSLLKPSRFNEGVKNRRSASIFRRRSLSQPRNSKPQLINRNINYKFSTPNPELSDSASNNDHIETATLKLHKEKSQTIDLSNSTNQNFIRIYRKPTEDIIQPRQKPDATQIDSAINLNIPSHFVKNPPNKVSVQSAQIARKMKTKSVSGSENSEEL